MRLERIVQSFEVKSQPLHKRVEYASQDVQDENLLFLSITV